MHALLYTENLMLAIFLWEVMYFIIPCSQFSYTSTSILMIELKGKFMHASILYKFSFGFLSFHIFMDKLSSLFMMNCLFALFYIGRHFVQFSCENQAKLCKYSIIKIECRMSREKGLFKIQDINTKSVYRTYWPFWSYLS